MSNPQGSLSLGPMGLDHSSDCGPGGTRGLTSEAEGVIVDELGGHEAESLFDEEIYLDQLFKSLGFCRRLF